MMLSARFEQCAALFALPKSTPDQRSTEHSRRLAPQSPTRLAKALERSALSPAKRQKGSKHRKGPTSLIRSRRFSIYDEAEPQQDLPEKKVRFDLTLNDIHEFKRKAPPSPRAKQSGVGATWESHQPGVNDFMSGGVASPSSSPHGFTSRPHTLRIIDDQTVAWFDLDAAVKAMPFKIVSKSDLGALNVFEDGFPDGIIGDDFHITYLGIQRAIEDAEDAMRYENVEHLRYDDILLGELARRAGILSGLEKVAYVEDMVPVVGQGDEDFDEEYWLMVWSQGSIWDELSAATKDAIAEGDGNAVDYEMSL